MVYLLHEILQIYEKICTGNNNLAQIYRITTIHLTTTTIHLTITKIS